MSTSATVQACGIVCLLLTMLLAMARRMGLSGTGVPGTAGAPAGRGGALLHLDLLQDAGEWRGNFRIHLVGDDFDQALVFLDLVARLLQPFRDGALGDRLPELRHFDGSHLPVGSP